MGLQMACCELAESVTALKTGYFTFFDCRPRISGRDRLMATIVRQVSVCQ